MHLKILALSVVLAAALSADATQEQSGNGKKHKSTEAEKGYTAADIQKGWAFGEDASSQKTEDIALVVPKGKRDAITILEESLAVQKEQLKEQRKIRAILEEQFDPKPHLIKKEDGTECVANSSSDCFEFPLIAEAKRVPVMANYLKNPHDEHAVAEWKKWFAIYLNHNFDIGKAAEYDAAENGSNSFRTDFRRDGYDNGTGQFNVMKGKHNSRVINAFGARGLSLKIFIGKTPGLDLFALDQVAIFIIKHPELPIELVFSNNESAEVYRGAAQALGIAKSAFSQKNVTKRIGSSNIDFPESLQSTPAYVVGYSDGKNKRTQTIGSGKISYTKLANNIIEWMIFAKIVDPAQLNDDKIWKDSGSGFAIDFYKDIYGTDVSKRKR